MSTIITDPSGIDPGTGGDPDDKNKTVSHEHHQRVLGEKKREAEARRKAEEELEQLRKEKSDREAAELERQGNYKKLLDDEKKKREEVESNFNSLNNSLLIAKKQSAVLRHINGKVPHDIVDALLKVEEVIVEADGSLNLDSVKKVAQDFEKKYHYVLQKDNANGGLPPDAAKGGITGTKISYAEWQALPAAEMKARMKDVDQSTAK